MSDSRFSASPPRRFPMRLRATLVALPVLISLLSIGAIDPLLAQSNGAWLDNYETALKTARSKKQLVILDIYAPWCGYCRKLQREVYPSQQVREITDQFVRVRINGEKHPRLMRKYGVRGFPTVILLDSRGKEIDRIGGYLPARSFARKLRDVQRKGNREKDLLDELKGKPESVMLNFRTGVYYYETGDAARARRYFLRSYKGQASSSTGGTRPLSGPVAGAEEKRRDALYNVAIASMDLKDHADALKYWNLYLKEYPKMDRDHSYARYYRGQSYFELGRKKQARIDFTFASRNLPEGQDRASAAQYLAALD